MKRVNASFFSAETKSFQRFQRFLAIFSRDFRLRVDATAGATVTSEAVLAAVEEAITKMGFDPAAFKK